MIGDVLTSSLICENLKRNYPEAEVHYLINRFTLPVVKNHPYIDHFVIFEDEYRHNRVKFYRFLTKISHSHYTHVFDAYSKLESLLMTTFSKANHKYAFNKFHTKLFYTKTVKIKKSSTTEAGTAIENRLELLKLMPNIKVYNNKPQIYLTSKEKETAKLKLRKINLDHKKCIMISALGSNASKTYPLPYMAEILNLVVKESHTFLILNYMPSQKKAIDKLLKLCKPITQSHIITDIDMINLRDFIGVCQQCDAIIGNEGGAINIAKALEIPSFSIFSPWIIKEGWNSFEISYPNLSVHLSDYNKNWFINNETKVLKQKANEYYQKLNPKLFQNKLKVFLKTYIG